MKALMHTSRSQLCLLLLRIMSSSNYINCQEGDYSCLVEIRWEYYNPKVITIFDSQGEKKVMTHWWYYGLDDQQALEEAFDKLSAIEIGKSRFDFERMIELRLDTGDEYRIRRIETNFWPY